MILQSSALPTISDPFAWSASVSILQAANHRQGGTFYLQATGRYIKSRCIIENPGPDLDYLPPVFLKYAGAYPGHRLHAILLGRIPRLASGDARRFIRCRIFQSAPFDAFRSIRRGSHPESLLRTLSARPPGDSEGFSRIPLSPGFDLELRRCPKASAGKFTKNSRIKFKR
jgi:hypothetical protein